MPRDIPVGNGRLLVTFDHQYQIRDIYFPHVGQENHAGAGPCRFGVYTDVPGKHRSAALLDERPRLDDPPALSARHAHHQRQPRSPRPEAGDVLQRRRSISTATSSSARSRSRTWPRTSASCSVMHHQDFNMFGTKIGDTAYFDPELRIDRPLPRQAVPDGDVLRRRRAAHRRIRHRHQRLPRRRRNLARRRRRPSAGQPDRPGRGRLARSRITCTSPPTASRPSTWSSIAGESREELLELHKWLVEDGPAGRDRPHEQLLAAVGRRDEHQLRQPAAEGRRSVQAIAAGRAHADRQRRRDHRRQRQRHHAVLARHVFVHVAARRRAGRRRAGSWPAFPTSPAGSTPSARA